MSVLSDRRIKELALEHGMITPYVDGQLAKGVISFGVSSYGYDVRLGNKFKVFDNWLSGYNRTIDPKDNSWHDAFTTYDCAQREWPYVTVPPNSFALGESLEVFKIPRNVLAVVLGKSTYARCGIIVNVTPLEPEWEGVVTIEISNTTPLPARIYAGEGIAQVLFLENEQGCERSYADKKGRYQSQACLTLPSINR